MNNRYLPRDISSTDVDNVIDFPKSTTTSLFDKLIAARKNPVQLAGLFGFGFILKLLTHNLDIGGLEKRGSELLRATVKAVVTPHPEIGIDLDKTADYIQLKASLEKKQETGTGFFAPV